MNVNGLVESVIAARCFIRRMQQKRTARMINIGTYTQTYIKLPFAVIRMILHFATLCSTHIFFRNTDREQVDL